MKFSILTFLFEKNPTYPDQNYSKIEMLQATKDFTQRINMHYKINKCTNHFTA